MTRNVKKEMKGYSSKCYFPEKRTLGLVASIPAVENVVTPDGEIQKTGKRATSNLWSMEIQTPSLQVNWSSPHPVRRIDWL